MTEKIAGQDRWIRENVTEIPEFELFRCSGANIIYDLKDLKKDNMKKK